MQNLISEQFPQWAYLPIRPVELGGWDNRTFHLGSEMLIRLPSAECYAAKVQIEQKWLPILAQHLSFQIPKPIAMGKPSKNYPWHWSIYKWIEGESANILTMDELDLNHLALQLTQFLNELHKIDIADAPLPGPHNFFRGGSLLVYDAETRSTLKLRRGTARSAILKLQNFINLDSLLSVWEKATSSKWNKKPVWIHGDLSSGNILIKDNQLAAVIDFGGMAIGDPACDLVIAWTFLKDESRDIFKSHLNLDVDTWDRACGWALWKALITLESLEDKTSKESLKQQQIILDLVDECNFENKKL